MQRHIFYAALASAGLWLAIPAQAQTAGSVAISPQVIQQAGAIAAACTPGWTTPTCLSAVSASNLVLASDYGSALQQSGHPAQAEAIKQHCAASTASTQGNYPAYAMRSAYIECANTISDVAQQTGIAPDPNQFQLLIGPTLCLSGDARCAAVTQGLQAYARH